eukprot:gb/GECH01009783.1/.p1 GENE.gb/GECH01009783.1/~~gb/GECH01009783.1/.p1  ORF type:complete len:135 (+),score=0.61 gb/GECH01009783.1/:1-405(+)
MHLLQAAPVQQSAVARVEEKRPAILLSLMVMRKVYIPIYIFFLKYFFICRSYQTPPRILPQQENIVLPAKTFVDLVRHSNCEKCGSRTHISSIKEVTGAVGVRIICDSGCDYERWSSEIRQASGRPIAQSSGLR